MNTTQKTGLGGTLGLLLAALAAKHGLQLDPNSLTVLICALGGALWSAVHHSGHVDRMVQQQAPLTGQN